MKLPSGTPLIRNEPIKNGDVTLILRRVPQSFNGYLAVTAIGYDGVEEGIFLIDGGNVTHAYYVHLKYVHEEWGNSALKPALNVFQSGGANVDVVEFTPPKLRLTATFNEQAKLEKPFPLSQLQGLIPASYDKSHVLNIIRLRPVEELEHLKRLLSVGLTFGRKEDIG
jgi:hypothetical protein